MPNWCMNSGHVTLPEGATERVREAFEKLRENEAEPGWFANVLPTPPEMLLGIGSAAGKVEYMSLDWLRSNSAFKGDFGTFETHKYENGDTRVEFKPSKEYLSYLEETYGDVNWYNWNVANYGVKWDVNAEIDENDDSSFFFSFDSAWGSPTEFFEHLAETYGLEFELRYIETGCRFAGILSYRNGDYHHEYAENNEEYLVLAVTEFDEPIDYLKSEVEEHESYEDYVEEHGAPSNEKLAGILRDYYAQISSSRAPVSVIAVKAAPAKAAKKAVKKAVKKAAKKAVKKAAKKS